MGRQVIAVICAFSVLSSGISLYAADGVSLDKLITEALRNSPDLRAAGKRWEASRARIPQAKSLEDPVVSFTFEKIPRNTFQLNNTAPEDRMLSISQALPSFGKLSLKKKIAVVEAQMAAAEYKGKELEITRQVKNAYYDLFMNRKEVELTGQNLHLLEAITGIAQARYAVGDISQEDVYKLTVEVMRLKTALNNLAQEGAAKKTRLNTLLNRDPEAQLGIPDIGEDVFFNNDIRSLYQAAVLNQPELAVFSYAIEKNKYAKALTKRSFFPDLMAQLTLRGITSGTIGPWDLMLAFTVPLWFWTKQRYQIKEAIANVEEAEAAYQAMKNRVMFETKDTAAKVTTAANKARLYKNEVVPLLESAAEVSVSALRSGKGQIMALLDTIRMLTEAKMNYYKALVEYNMNISDLERVTGGNYTRVNTTGVKP